MPAAKAVIPEYFTVPISPFPITSTLVPSFKFPAEEDGVDAILLQGGKSTLYCVALQFGKEHAKEHTDQAENFVQQCNYDFWLPIPSGNEKIFAKR